MSKEINIYVPLDVLLDTRIAVISMMDENKAIDILRNGYHNRRSDIFKDIDKDEFDALYSKRDINVLLRSQCTNAVLFLSELITELQLKVSVTPQYEKVSLYINTYPYVLDEETVENITGAISFWIKDLCKIGTIHLSDEELTPEYIKDRFNILFMYHYANWLEVNTDNFSKTSINDCTLYVPAISFEHDLTDELIQNLTKMSMHPIQAVRVLLAPFVKVDPIDVSVFSVLNKC